MVVIVVLWLLLWFCVCYCGLGVVLSVLAIVFGKSFSSFLSKLKAITHNMSTDNKHHNVEITVQTSI